MTRQKSDKTTASYRFAALVKEHIEVLLRSHGFGRNKLVFEKNIGEFSWLVDVQKSRHNESNEIQFTVNCGVFSAPVMKIYANVDASSKPGIEHCCCSSRIGMLTQGKTDIWWKIDGSVHVESDDAVGREVVGAVEQYVFPFLERFPNLGAVAEFLSMPLSDATKYVTPRSVPLRKAFSAIIYSDIGDLNEAERQIQAALAESLKSPAEESIRTVATKLRTRNQNP